MKRCALLAPIALFFACKEPPQPPQAKADGAVAAPVDASTTAVAVRSPRQTDPFLRFDPATALLKAVPGRPILFERERKLTEIELDSATWNIQPRAVVVALNDELAAGVRAGRLDEAKLIAKKEDLRKAMVPVFEGEANALNKLHAIFDAAERAEIATKATARFAGGHFHSTNDLLSYWVVQLDDLDDAKKKALLNAVPTGEALNDALAERMRLALDAFRKDDFDVKRLDALDPKKAAMPLDEETAFLRKVIPLLSVHQRKELADKVAARSVEAIRD